MLTHTPIRCAAAVIGGILLCLPVLGSHLSAPAAAAEQPAGDSMLSFLRSPRASLIRQRAQHIYRMPDGRIWDGYNREEFRRIISRHLNEFERIQRVKPAPGANIVEDKPAGTVWKIRRNADTEAWGIFGSLARERDGELEYSYQPRSKHLPLLATLDPRRWKDVPPLWSSAESDDFTWDFALIDEDDPDPWTKKNTRSYLRITRDWGDGQYEFEGHTTDLGLVEGMIFIPDPRRQVQRDRLRGRFFLWPEGSTSEPGGYSRPSWRYIPADELRISPDDLAAALIDGEAVIIEWKHEKVGEQRMWRCTILPVELAEPATPRMPVPSAPPPEVGREGPDLIMLRDGRWYRGRLVEQTDDSITLATKVGELDSLLVFSADEVSEVQSPERKP